jgi:hypothetical protein
MVGFRPTLGGVMAGTYYRMVLEKNGDFACWRVRDEIDHLCILEAKAAVREIDPPIMEALKKAKPNQKKFTKTSQTIGEVIHRVVEKYEPGIWTVWWLREWLKWYIPTWRSYILYPQHMPTPRVEHLGEAELEVNDKGLTGYHVIKNKHGTVIERFSDRLLSVS